MSQIELALDRCQCSELFIVTHSMGGLIVMRVLTDLLLHAPPDGPVPSLFQKLKTVLLIAPPFYPRPGFELTINALGWGQLRDVSAFSRFQEGISNDLQRLRQGAPRRYAEGLTQRTILLLASDDGIIDNAATRSQFRDFRIWELPGGHS